MDLTATMVVCNLADALGQDATKLVPAFLESRTASLLYADSLKYWWDGPDAIGDMFKEETSSALSHI